MTSRSEDVIKNYMKNHTMGEKCILKIEVNDQNKKLVKEISFLSQHPED